jgi:hypothetical protein
MRPGTAGSAGPLPINYNCHERNNYSWDVITYVEPGQPFSSVLLQPSPFGETQVN